MAYKNLIAEDLDASSETEWFMRMRDFVCKRNGTYDYSLSGIGWTLHDAVYAADEDNVAVNDYIVVYSAGEEGVDDLYYQITLINDYITIHGWQYWDAGTHTGSGIHYYRDNGMQIRADPEQIWIYGDLDFVHMVAVGVAGNTNWYNGAFGLLETNYLKSLENLTVPVARNVQTCSTPLTAGAGVSIVVPDSSSRLWQAGRNLMIMDNTNFEMLTVTTNDGNGNMTATLSNSYTAGARISVVFPYFVTGGSNSTHFYYSGKCVCMHDMAGNHAGTFNEAMTFNYGFGTAITNLNVGGATTWNSAYSIVPYSWYDATNGYIGNLPHCGYTPGTGLVTNDLLDDLVDPTIQWRYNAMTNTRVIKELK